MEKINSKTEPVQNYMKIITDLLKDKDKPKSKTFYLTFDNNKIDSNTTALEMYDTVNKSRNIAYEEFFKINKRKNKGNFMTMLTIETYCAGIHLNNLDVEKMIGGRDFDIGIDYVIGMFKKSKTMADMFKSITDDGKKISHIPFHNNLKIQISIE